uniref:Uncharacterized protein n=1 Tax=Leersia perrieri TaxID=77586 RepID=A0A0D9XKC2_9ORYZ
MEQLRMDKNDGNMLGNMTSYLFCNISDMDQFSVMAPQGIEKLRNLHMLGVVSVGKNNGVARKLERLTNLQRLGVTCLSEEEGQELCNSIKNLNRLQRLEVHSKSLRFLNNNNIAEVPPKYLVSLRLCGLLDSLPTWIKLLNDLTKVKLLGTKLVQVDIDCLKDLRNLASLGLWEKSYKDNSLHFNGNTFPKLIFLDIDGLEDIETININEAAMPKLQQLWVNKCHKLRINQDGLSGVSHLLNLNELVLKKCGDNEVLVKLLQRQLSTHEKRPKFLRHNAVELPVPVSFGGERDEKAAGKMAAGAAKQGRGAGGCCSRLWFMLVLTATVTILVRHFYDSGLAHGGAAAVVRIESVPHPSYLNRKANPANRHHGGGADVYNLVPFAAPNRRREAGTQSPGAAVVRFVIVIGGPFARALAAAENKSDRCGGRYVYIQELPPKFNTDMVNNCATLFPWTDMCAFTANGGFGPPLHNDVFQETGWYNSDQYTADIIFHDRIRRYDCLTDDATLAAAVYVPFFAGLEVARHLWGGHNATTRDAMANEFVEIVTSRREWRAMGGRDHFFTAGRTTWDFRRLGDGDGNWGSKLFRLPAVTNMTALVVEASPWHFNDAAVPFPTAFHPASDEAVFLWQDKIRRLERRWLFTFAGADRPGSTKSIRSELISQCKSSSVCSLMECADGPRNKCGSPASYMRLFQSSTFCLQPQGDSYTRKSAFDAMLAGCIPVFFHPGTAYVQYTWHLPRNHTDYSVYISENDVRNNVSIEDRLRRIPPATVEKMRETVIGLIPSLVYAQPTSRLETMKDAFDVTIDAVIDKVARLRRDIVEGRRGGEVEEKLEMYSWKYPLLREGQKVEDPHEWDPLFAFST